MEPRAVLLRRVPVLAFTVLIATVPFIVENRFMLKILTFTGANVLIVIGMALLFGYAGQISLGHAGFFGLGAYTSAILVKSYGIPWIAGLVAGAAIAAAGGLLLAVPSLRLKGHYLAMATLGFGQIMHVMFVELRSVTGGPDGLSKIPPAAVGGFAFETPQLSYLLVWATTGFAALCVWNLIRSRPGRALRALHSSEAGTEASGIDVARLKILVFALSAAIAGIGGALYAHYAGFISPSVFTLHRSIIFVAMVVVGGTNSLGGPILGAVLLSLIPFIDAFIPGIPRDVAMIIQE